MPHLLHSYTVIKKKTSVETTQVVVGPVAVGTNQSLVNQCSNNRTVVLECQVK